MKLFFVVVAGVFLFAGPLWAQRSCSNQAYVEQGWVVHPSTEFDQKRKKIDDLVQAGLKSGTIVFDISGPIATRHTVSGQTLLLDAMMFDNLETERDTMYGDFAIIVQNETGVWAEVRWFDGEKRHVVINDQLLTCICEQPPLAYNSVL